ncbi:MAG: glutathione S-transferase family protein [Pseudomonadales bacterium]|nr:glutathione S-transferase family protein [Pseudomonadales bacterium]
MLKVHGVPLSPFVRKALLTLEYKGIDYDLVPVMPASDDPGFRAMSPLGKIPVLEHDGFTIPDSSIVCRYLDRVFPDKPIYPSYPALEAKATWIEEFADTKLMEACAGLFQQKFLFPKLMNKPTDEAIVDNILRNVMPAALAYVESITPESGPMVGDHITIADIAIVTCFAQSQYADFEVPSDYPRLKAYLAGAMANETVAGRITSERKQMGL